MATQTSYALINPGTASFIATPEMRKHYEQGGTFITDNPKLTNDRVSPLTLKVPHGAHYTPLVWYYRYMVLVDNSTKDIPYSHHLTTFGIGEAENAPQSEKIPSSV